LSFSLSFCFLWLHTSVDQRFKLFSLHRLVQRDILAIRELVKGSVPKLLNVAIVAASLLYILAQKLGHLLDLLLCDDVWTYVDQPCDALSARRDRLAAVIEHVGVWKVVYQLFKRNFDLARVPGWVGA